MATDDESEYGGVGGVIQPAAKGHNALTAQEKRTVNAVYRHRMAGVDVTIPPSDLHRPFVDEILAELPDRTAGRTPNEAEGENVS
jgi:hypothetical protein